MNTPKTHVFVCFKCKNKKVDPERSGQHLLDLFEKHTENDPSVVVHPMKCFGLCTESYGIGATIHNAGKQTNVLGELTADQYGAETLHYFVKLTQHDEHAQLARVRVCPTKQFHYKYRIPTVENDVAISRYHAEPQP